jgi:predicted protein tyrosine phosphatase
MRVWVCNRRQAEAGMPEFDSIQNVISISTPGHDEANIPGEWSQRLNLSFHDIVPEDVRDLRTVNGKDLTPFTREMAEASLGWIESLPKDEDILVHCDAGVSRSVGMGQFIQRLTDRELYILTPGMSGVDQFGNVHVSAMMARIILEQDGWL